MRNPWKHCLFGTTFLASVALAVSLMFVAAPLVRADERDCQRRVARADQRLDQAVARHGWRSKQAEGARHDLRAARERCWKTNHQWWDERAHRWHSERDWGDNDRERDHDRH